MPHSIVEYFGLDGGHKCGYCGGKKSNLSHGMWGHHLQVEDYQVLIDRGWRRSGKYLYKPIMARTCCPQYPIRCLAPEFKPTRSHKKVLKRFRKYVLAGEKRGGGASNGVDEADDKRDDSEENSVAEGDQERLEEAERRLGKNKKKKALDLNEDSKPPPTPPKKPSLSSGAEKSTPEAAPQTSNNEKTKEGPKKASNPDPSKPLPKKAKEMRRERARLKGKTGKPPRDPEKTLEDFLSDPFPADAAHTFEIRTVMANDSDADFRRTYDEVFGVYKKYQMKVHGDKPDKVTPDQFSRFLCDASLRNRDAADSDDGQLALGAYHQQYVLDGRIFCVGVVDVLPDCVSSVYLFYDPDFAFLSPGTLSSLYELAFVRKLASSRPKLKFYYMGFYIHTCPKMRYKAQYSPSYLLCSETYEWREVSACIKKLDASKYARFAEDEVASEAAVDVAETLVFYDGIACPFRLLKELKARENEEGDEADASEVAEYSGLVGSALTQTMLLYRE